MICDSKMIISGRFASVSWDRREGETVMGVSVKAVLGSVAVCGVLLLAGCGGSSGATAEGGWNPPRPTGVPDEKWESIDDPATLSNFDLAAGYCQVDRPTSVWMDAKVQEYPGSTVDELNAYYDYVEVYVEPLCEALPPPPTTKGPASTQTRRL